MVNGSPHRIVEIGRIDEYKSSLLMSLILLAREWYVCNLMSLIIVSICDYVVITSQCGVFSSSVLVVGCLRLKRWKTEAEILCNI